MKFGRETNATRVARSLVAKPAPAGEAPPTKLLPKFEWDDVGLRAFCERLLHEENRPRMGRTLMTDREMVHWDRTDWPELWDLCLAELRETAPGRRLVQATYVIRYRVGVELAPHRDSGAMRMIVLARAAGSGGALSVEGAEVALGVGDAVVFSDSRTHAVSKVTSGERWTITMGLG